MLFTSHALSIFPSHCQEPLQAWEPAEETIVLGDFLNLFQACLLGLAWYEAQLTHQVPSLCQASVPAASAMAPLSLENSASSEERDQNRNYSGLPIVTELLCGCVRGGWLVLPWVSVQIHSSPGRVGDKLGC